MMNFVAPAKKNQELVSRLTYPFFLAIHVVTAWLYRKLRLEGIVYGLRRARMRANIGHLGPFSDISPNVVIRHPEGLSIGVRSSIGYGSFVDAGGGVSIGDFVQVSHMVSINSMSHPATPPYYRTIKAPTRIHDHAWVGANSVIMHGIEIGEGAIVGAGSVVTHSVEPYTIVAGVPARVVRRVNRPEGSSP